MSVYRDERRSHSAGSGSFRPAHGGPPRGQEGGPGIDVSEQKNWIESIPAHQGLASLGNQDLVQHAERLGQKFKDALSTTKLRNLYDRVNALNLRLARQFAEDEVPLLKVRLAYAAAREKKDARDLVKVLLPAVDRIHSQADFRWFVRFVEAIVAYHRYHGGREDNRRGRE